MKTLIRLSGFLLYSQVLAYPPAAGQAGSDAIIRTDARFVSWAKGYQAPVYGSGVDSTWKTPDLARGPATTNGFDIVCLGNEGTITMYFPRPIRDGAGADFAVFENAFGDTFLELAFVEVSSDGLNFFRFPNVSLTSSAVGPFGSVNPVNLTGLAGKYRIGYGTPFDLAVLPAGLDKEHVCFVRIVDIIGNGNTKDSMGNPIYDPTPTTGSGGFDLEAIGVIHQNVGPPKVLRAEVSGGAFQLMWASNPGVRYQVETSTTMSVGSWTFVVEKTGSLVTGSTGTDLGLSGPKRFWRVLTLN